MLVWLLHWLINYRIGVYLGSCVLWYYRHQTLSNTHHCRVLRYVNGTEYAGLGTLHEYGKDLLTFSFPYHHNNMLTTIYHYYYYYVIDFDGGHIKWFFSTTTIKRWPVATPNKIIINIIVVELQFDAFVSLIPLRWYQQVSVWKCLLLLLTPINSIQPNDQRTNISTTIK